MKNKKKIVILVIVLISSIAYIAYTNIISNNSESASEDIPLHDGDILVTSDDVTDQENTDTYLQEMRATLDMERNKIISILSETEASASSSDEKENASKEKLKLLEYMEAEQTIETLISNKGLPDSFVVITDSGVNVTVNTTDLDQPTVTKITEIIMRQTDRPAAEIVIQDAS